MNKNSLLEILNGGQLAIPLVLLQHISALQLSSEQFVILLQIMAAKQKGELFPTPDELGRSLHISGDDVFLHIRQLMQKGCLAIVDNEVGQEQYSLDPLWDKLSFVLFQAKQAATISDSVEEERKLFRLFEQEFARALSPMELEMLSHWLDEDHHDPMIITAALREAVMVQKLSFRYIDRILFEWKKKGIKTIQQAQQQAQQFRKPEEPATPKENPTIPFYNWLEE